jgi:hypothetical protein
MLENGKALNMKYSLLILKYKKKYEKEKISYYGKATGL